MKWSIQQLRRLPCSPFPFHYSFDFSENIATIEDIIAINNVEVEGTISLIDFDTFNFSYRVKAKLLLACSLTLEPVEYLIDSTIKELYGLNESEEVTLIEGNTVDLKAMVWTTIIINKPIRVVREDAYQILAQRKIILDDDIPDEE